MHGPRRAERYRATVPRIVPTNAECVPPDAGTGDNTAFGRPRFVTVTASLVAIHLLTSARRGLRRIGGWRRTFRAVTPPVNPPRLAISARP